MLGKKTRIKEIRVQFTSLTKEQETAIKEYMAPYKDELFSDDIDQKIPADKRDSLRISPENLSVKLTVVDTSGVENHVSDVKVIDLSNGGICLSVPEDLIIKRNSQLNIHVELNNVKCLLTGSILGLQYED